MRHMGSLNWRDWRPDHTRTELIQAAELSERAGPAQKADAALEGALKERETDAAAGELAAAMQRIGELSMEVELLRERSGKPGPLARRRSR